MGYSLNLVDGFGAPFQVVHEQTVLVPTNGNHRVNNRVRKILFVVSGEMRHQVIGASGKNADVILRAGDLIALPHRCQQQYTGLEAGSVGRLHVVRLSFDPDRLPPLTLPTVRTITAANMVPTDGIEVVSDRCLQEVHYVRAARNAALQETLSHLREEARLRLPDYKLRVYGLCVCLTVLVARQIAEQQTTDQGAERPIATYHVGKIKDYLRHHLHRPLVLADVASHVQLTEEHTARLFKKETGVTVFEYARRLRVNEAKSLLATTEQNVSEIAHATGYASPTVFSRNFRRETGASPSEFRQHIARQMG